jgi:hypothetical protein
MPRRRMTIEVERVRTLVAAGATQSDLAHEFRCSVTTIRTYLRRHGIVAAFGDTSQRSDPSPDEIRRLAAEIKERNLRQYAREDWETTRVRLWKEGILQET